MRNGYQTVQENQEREVNFLALRQEKLDTPIMRFNATKALRSPRNVGGRRGHLFCSFDQMVGQ